MCSSERPAPSQVRSTAERDASKYSSDALGPQWGALLTMSDPNAVGAPDVTEVILMIRRPDLVTAMQVRNMQEGALSKPALIPRQGGGCTALMDTVENCVRVRAARVGTISCLAGTSGDANFTEYRQAIRQMPDSKRKLPPLVRPVQATDNVVCQRITSFLMDNRHLGLLHG